ncbi:MAG: SRPBCC domain-containing protein [Phycisphaera sp.]|nr:MAG: SRPBCC domain-containing protein [Phycisphaera sp.]
MPLDFDCSLEITIGASPAAVQRAVLEDIGQWMVSPQNNELMSLRIEPHVGGRVFRDLGEGQGHLWAHISVLKPGLIEMVGPFANIEPSYSLIRFRFHESGTNETKLEFTHQATGSISNEMGQNAEMGWRQVLEKGLKEHVERSN